MTIALYLLGTAVVGAVVITFPLALHQLVSKDSEPIPDLMSDWTGADYDSYQVLASIGVPYPAARVTQARASRIVRPAGGRTVRTHSGLRRIAAATYRGTAR